MIQENYTLNSHSLTFEKFEHWSSHNILHMLGVTGSVFCTVGLGIERYIAICHPFYHYSRKLSWRVYIFPIILQTIGLNAIFILLKRFGYNTPYIVVMISSLFGVPTIALLVINALIVKTLNRNRNNFENGFSISHGVSSNTVSWKNRTNNVPISIISGVVVDSAVRTRKNSKRRKKNSDFAIINLAIDSVFVFSHCLNVTSFFIEHYLEISPPHLHSISNVFVVLSSSINFYVFIFKTNLSFIFNKIKISYCKSKNTSIV